MTRTEQDSRLRVLIIEHERTADAALVGECLDAANVESTVVGPEIGVAIPASADGFDGIIVLGGSPGPGDDTDAPWLPGVRELMAQALEASTPLLGICLGAQLLAHVAGGTVREIAGGPEIGLVELQLTDEGRKDPLLGGIGDTANALQWHWLEVSSLPPGSTVLCSSTECENQAFRVGANAWGVQFHMEALARTARQWSLESAETLAELRIDAEPEIIEKVERAEAALRSRWSMVTRRWIDIVRDHARAGTAV